DAQWSTCHELRHPGERRTWSRGPHRLAMPYGQCAVPKRHDSFSMTLAKRRRTKRLEKWAIVPAALIGSTVVAIVAMHVVMIARFLARNCESSRLIVLFPYFAQWFMQMS